MKPNGKIARAAASLGISVAGLFMIRFMVQALPMFRDMGWIVKDKLTVVAAGVIVVDAMLLSVLIGFALQLRAYFSSRFAQVPALGTMAVSVVLLLCTGIGYTDFKPLTRAWPSVKEPYVWGFSALATVLLVYVTVLLYQTRDHIAALMLRQPAPDAFLEQTSQAKDAKAALADR